ncbi:MAG: CAP domain-containing protein [Chloroflexota bacterium]|nr:CAP domain-containing protein [Chloroflexota bacterium]
MGRAVTLLVAVAMLLLSPFATQGTAAADDQELAFLELVNAYRVGFGLGALTLDPALTAAAEYHSQDMGSSGFFSHTLSDGTTTGENLLNHGYAGGTWGENIAAGMETAADAFVAWQNSPGHNANMLRADFGTIGIGRAYVEGSPMGWYWTTTFGGSPDDGVPPTFDFILGG